MPHLLMFFGVSVSLIAVIIMGIEASEHRKNIISARCHAAQQTILDEAELIAAGGKFPGEQVTNRWKALLEGCS